MKGPALRPAAPETGTSDLKTAPALTITPATKKAPKKAPKKALKTAKTATKNAPKTNPKTAPRTAPAATLMHGT
ncbi:MAG: hypothetical protein QXG08_03560 [Candidatus Methanomethyliaceae archaeon]